MEIPEWQPPLEPPSDKMSYNGGESVEYLMPHVIHDDLEFVDTTIRPLVDFRSDEVHDQPQYKDFCDSTHANGDLDRHHEQLISRQAVSVKGKLSQSVEFWRDTLKANNYVLSVISNGYVLPFKEEPPHKVFRNHNVCSKYSKFIDESVQELLVNDCIEQTLEVPHVCSPLSVVCSSTGKLRLVLDLRYVNRYLWKYKFNPLSAVSVYIRSTLVNRHRGERIYTLILVFIAYRMLTRLTSFRGSPY